MNSLPPIVGATTDILGNNLSKTIWNSKIDQRDNNSDVAAQKPTLGMDDTINHSQGINEHALPELRIEDEAHDHERSPDAAGTAALGFFVEMDKDQTQQNRALSSLVSSHGVDQSDSEADKETDNEESHLLGLNTAAVSDGSHAHALTGASSPLVDEHDRRERHRRRKEEKKLRRKQRKGDKDQKSSKGESRVPKRRGSTNERDSGRQLENYALMDGVQGEAAAQKLKRQTLLDQYQREADETPRCPPANFAHCTNDTDAEYYYRKFHSMRRSTSTDELQKYSKNLQDKIAFCLHTGSYEENEAALLELLQPLALLNVSYAQLRDSRIGVVVGQLLKGSFPLCVSQLANAVLKYWFKQLPQSMQQTFSVNSEIDRCSIDTTVGERSDTVDAALGTVGVHIFESFTEEEIDDASPNVNVVEVCKTIETALQEKSNDRDTYVVIMSTLGDLSNTALRRAILSGKITAQNLIENANDLNTLLRSVNDNGRRSIATDFTSAGSPTTAEGSLWRMKNDEEFVSPTGRNSLGSVSTLYLCPNCGAQEISRTGYSVQAHDNFPNIMKCRSCNNTWNIAL